MTRYMTPYGRALQQTRRGRNELVDILADAQASVKADPICVIFSDVTCWEAG